jgi:hypothetical protein
MASGLIVLGALLLLLLSPVDVDATHLRMPIRNARQKHVHDAQKVKKMPMPFAPPALPLDPRDPKLPILEQTNWEKELEENAAEAAAKWFESEDNSAKQTEAETILLGLFSAEKLRKLSADEQKQVVELTSTVGKLAAARLRKDAGKESGEQRAIYSSHDCVGNVFEREDPYNPSDFSLGPWRYRSCHFSDICYSPYRNEFLYFSSPQHLAKEEEMRQKGHTSYDESNGKSRSRADPFEKQHIVNQLSFDTAISALSTTWAGRNGVKWRCVMRL